MSRPPLGCMSCSGTVVGYDDDGRFWTKDSNGARWLVYPQPAASVPGLTLPPLWTAYTDQYKLGDYLTPPLSQELLYKHIEIFANANKTSVLSEPSNPYDVNYTGTPFKTIPTTPTFGPGAPPIGSLPADVTPPAVDLSALPPVATPPSAAKPAETKSNLTVPLVVGGVAALLLFSSLSR